MSHSPTPASPQNQDAPAAGEIPAAAVQRAVVDAFRAAAFGAAPGAGRPTEFERQLQQAVALGAEDRKVLGRVLWDVAWADGRIASEEAAFLREYLGGEVSVESVTGADLRRVTPAARETVLMIGWALALVDRELTAAEIALLEQNGADLQVPPARVQALREAARDFIRTIAGAAGART